MKEKDEIELFKASIYEENRPWGKFRSFPHEMAQSIKIITVNPGASLSLQYHHHRSEFWVVLDPGLEITVGEKVWQPQVNEEIFIPRLTPHRLRCLAPHPGRVLEIWLGASSEDDIVRLEDDYGRT